MRKIVITVFGLFAFHMTSEYVSADIIVDFEELTQFTGDNPAGGGQFYNGNDGSGITNENGWTSSGVFFNNSYTNSGSFDFWSGWSYSNVVNQTVPGFTNQYASWPGGGSDGFGGVIPGEKYAVAFGANAYFNLPGKTLLSSVELANTTYAALSMRDGDGFGKKFGGDTGSDPDFFRLVLTGFDDLDRAGNAVGSITVDLADFTFADNSDDYILQEWLTVDLSSFSNARSVAIDFESSDVGPFGINTPMYVALDNLTLTSVPEPSVLAMLLGITTIAMFIRFRTRNLLLKDGVG